jgi:hypothetical protein
MSATTLRTHIVAVEAPDGAAALELERRLAHVAPAAVARADSWWVEIPAAPGLTELEAVVRDWLDDIGTATTTMMVDGRRVPVSGRRTRRVRRRTMHSDFIG